VIKIILTLIKVIQIKINLKLYFIAYLFLKIFLFQQDQMDIYTFGTIKKL